MGNWKGIIARSFDAQEFDVYCHELEWTKWRPLLIVLHNTAIPSLKDRPQGFTAQHMLNFQKYYRDTNKWSAGPHLFIDDVKIWVFTPLTMSGVHSPSWNKVAIGIEMLGDYNKEEFDKGRGALVRDNAVAAMATLCAVLGLDAYKMKVHREDPLTSHKGCPGKDVNKGDVIQRVRELLVVRHGGEHIAHAGSV